jgi:hypothetical protein
MSSPFHGENWFFFDAMDDQFKSRGMPRRVKISFTFLSVEDRSVFESVDLKGREALKAPKNTILFT